MRKLDTRYVWHDTGAEMAFMRNKNGGSRLKWLLSETLVVVLGVLIAIGINDWWTDRQERGLERAYLERLLVDVRADLEYIRVLMNRLEQKRGILDEIAPVVRGQAPVPENAISFLRQVALGGMTSLAGGTWANRTTFDDLVATGNLRLLRNAALRRQVSNYYKQLAHEYERLESRRSGYAQFTHQYLPAELRDDMTDEAIAAFGIERAVAAFTSPEFNALLARELNYTYFHPRSRLQHLASELEASLVAALDAASGEPVRAGEE